jgi:ankyrin repeat protein
MIHAVAAFGSTWGHKVMTEDERVAFATMLLDAGARLDARDDLLLSTPLGWACRYGRAELADLLLSRGAPASEPDAESWATPLAWARKMKHAEIERRLLEAGAAA